MPNERLRNAKRIVVKVGSSLLADLGTGVDRGRIDALVDALSALRRAGREVILVSSGAVAAGAARLELASRPAALPLIQAAAAVGQGRLMRHYDESFARHGLAVGQMLLTRDGMDDRVRYLNARNTLFALLELGCVPVVNENDTVMVEEIQFGDNDQLSALVAVMAGAELLVLLSDVDGLHERSPAEGESPLVERVEEVTPEIEALAGASTSGVSRGGMASKLGAAKIATGFGVDVLLTSGREPSVLGRIASGDPCGTWFLARPSSASPRKQWLAGRQPAGRIRVDAGARTAIVEKGKSLLPVGMIEADECIAAGGTVSLVDPEGREFARGISNFRGEELQRICKTRSEDAPAILGYACATTVVHRDNLVLLAAPGS